MKKFVPFEVSTHFYFADISPLVGIIFSGDTILVRRFEDKIFLPCTVEEEFVKLADVFGKALCIGKFEEAECGVWDLPQDFEWQKPQGTEFIEIRSAMYLMDDMSVKAIARARELLFWRKKRQYCGVCGRELGDNENDISRICHDCGSTFYPVLAPAVIVAVRKENKILLAHNAKFKGNMYGLVAGFVEAGENLESAVAREVREETGISIKNIRYFSSQVWPFPNSLMVGFFAD